MRTGAGRSRHRRVLAGGRGGAPKRDPVDERIIGMSKPTGRLIDSGKWGGWPGCRTYNVPVDSEAGMVCPDWWEEAHGLNPLVTRRIGIG